MIELRDSSFDVGVNADLNFLTFDDDELTEAALRRITQMIDNREEALLSRAPTVETLPLRECKLFMNVKSVESVPSKHGCLGMCKQKYRCDVEVLGSKQTYMLKSQVSDIGNNYTMLVNDRQSYFSDDGKRSPPSWDLAEYYGPTKIVFTLKRRKLLSDVVVGTKTISISELLSAQGKATAKHMEAPSGNRFWSVDYAIPISTTLRMKKRKEQSTATSSSCGWLGTSKTPPFSPKEHPDEGKAMMEAEMAPLSSRAQTYVQVPADATQSESHRLHNHYKKDRERGAVVHVRIEFRLVQFQNCQHLCLTHPAPALATLCSAAPTSRAIGANQNRSLVDASSSASTLQISELHLLAANAPPGVLVDVMRGLSRRDALAGALALRSAETAHMTAEHDRVDDQHSALSVSAESSLRSLRFGAASSRRTTDNNPLGSSGSSNAHAAAPGVGPTAASAAASDGTNPLPALTSSSTVEGVPPTWTPLEFALLNQQEATVFELLQRCGGLCFTNITPGCATPLHTAVRGGSSQCVEYLGRYLKRYGAKTVTGPGARLWNSSLSAKLEWKDQNGDTVLALACRLPRTTSAHSIVLYLLMLGSDPGALNEQNGFTPLMYACQSGAAKVASILLSITKSSQDVMDAILNVGDVNSILNNVANLDVEPAVRDQIQAAIADAAHSARSSALATHLQSNPRSRNILRGENILDGGYFNPLSLYLCDPCRKDTATGRQAMHIAAEQGNADIVEALLNVGMSGGETDLFGDNSLHIAARRGHASVIALLLEAERKGWAAHLEIVGQGRSLQTMRHRARPLLAKNSMGDSPIDLALEAGHFQLAEDLIAGAARTYGRLDHLLLRKLLRQLEESAARVASQAPAFPSFSFSTSTSSGASKRSHKHSHKDKEGRDGDEGDKYVTRCRALLVRLIEEDGRGHGPGSSVGTVGSAVAENVEIDAFRVNTAGKSLQEAAFIDNEADSVEYIMALSSLGLKFIADNLSSTSGLQHANSARGGEEEEEEKAEEKEE